MAGMAAQGAIHLEGLEQEGDSFFLLAEAGEVAA